MTEISARSLGRNSIYAAILQIWQMGSRFVITPIIIAHLGLSGYGTWTLLFGICSYISMFDTSFGFAYTKYTAENEQRGDYENLSEIIGSGMALITGIGLIILILLWFFRWRILEVLRVPPLLLPDAGTALMIIAVCFFLRMSFGSVYQILSGLQRIDLQYKLTMLASGLEFGTALGLIMLGYGLVGLAVGHFCGQITGTVLGRILCWRICPELKISPFAFSRRGLRQVIALGGRFQLLSFSNTAIGQGVRMLISGLCGVSMLAIFELADKLIGFGKTISTSIIAPLMPAFANLHAGKEKHKWCDLYLQISKLVAIATAISLSFLFVFADRVLILWTGHNYPLAVWSIRVMLLSDFLNLMTGAGTASLRGKGDLRLELRYILVSCLVILPLIVPAGLWSGYQAMVLVMTTGQIVGALWFLSAFSRREGIDYVRYCREIMLKPFMLGAAAALVFLLFRPITDRLVPAWPARWSCVFEIMLWMPVFFSAMGIVFWYVMFFPAERQKVLDQFRTRKKTFPKLPNFGPKTELSSICPPPVSESEIPAK